MNEETRDERLRRILRAADPADRDTGLTTEEVREMRRTVLTAIPEPRRRFVLFPTLAGAAVAVLAAVTVLMMWPRSESPMPPPPVTSKIAVKTSRTDVNRTDVRPGMNARATDGGPVRDRVLAGPGGDTVGSPAASAPGGLAAANTPAPPNEPEPRTRQIQFDTPGGTRVIWILTSNNAL